MGSIKNKNIEVTNLEIRCYENEKAGSMIYISTSKSSYRIEEEIYGIYNAVLNSSLSL